MYLLLIPALIVQVIFNSFNKPVTNRHVMNLFLFCLPKYYTNWYIRLSKFIACMSILKKLLHSALITTLLLSPVARADSATLMNEDSSTLESSSLKTFSTATPHHFHSNSVVSDSLASAQEGNNAHSQSCCQDCNDECSQICMFCIVQSSTLALSHSLNTAISFIEASYFFISVNSPDRPPRIN